MKSNRGCSWIQDLGGRGLVEAGHSRAREVAVCVEGGGREGMGRGGKEVERREGGRGRERGEYLWIYFLIL